MTSGFDRDDTLAPMARAMLVEARVEELGEAFETARIPALLLAGSSPGVVGESGAEPIRVLVPRRMAAGARRVMSATGWELFWFAPGSAHYERDRIGLDLFWRISFPRSARALLRALWAYPRAGKTPFREPRAEPLLVLGALDRGIIPLPCGEIIRRCVPDVRDWQEVWRLAEAVGARESLEAATSNRPIPPPAHIPDSRLWRTASFLSRARLRFHEDPLHPFSCEFAGLSLHLGLGVFHPQPTAERMVKAALQLLDGVEHPTVVDVGTGCGAVALALASERPDAQVHGVDISPAAIKNARRNARRLGRPDVRFHHGSLLDPVNEMQRSVDMLTSVLPYLPSSVAAASEQLAPRVALDGGSDDGLVLMRDLADRGRHFLKPGGWWLLQQTEHQWESFSPELAEMEYAPRLLARWPGKVVVAGAQWRGAHSTA